MTKQLFKKIIINWPTSQKLQMALLKMIMIVFLLVVTWKDLDNNAFMYFIYYLLFFKNQRGNLSYIVPIYYILKSSKHKLNISKPKSLMGSLQ